jgi:AcrR family transcriptional regulator
MEVSALQAAEGPESIQRLTQAALECFAERGFHGTTTRQIADRVDMSPAAIYTHFKSKDELLFLIMRMTMEEALRRMTSAYDDNDEPRERLLAVVRAVVSFNAEWHTAARVANHEIPALRGQPRASIRSLRRQIESLMEQTIELGVKAGVFATDDVRAASFAILSMAIGVSRWFVPGGRLSAVEIGSVYADLTLRMLSTSRAPRRVRKEASRHAR